MPGSKADSPASVAAGTDPDAAQRRNAQARRAARLWGEVTLAGIVVLGGFTLWHLRRRSRLLHDHAGAPRRVEWPEMGEEKDAEP